MKALEFDHVSYRYPGEDFSIVDNLSFALEQGSFHCVIGASGCGKSTILRLTCGLLRSKAGTIRVNGRPVAEQSHYCGYMPQRDLLFPWRTVGEPGPAPGDPGRIHQGGAAGAGGGGPGGRWTGGLPGQDAKRALRRDAAAGGLRPHHAGGQ